MNLTMLAVLIEIQKEGIHVCMLCAVLYLLQGTLNIQACLRIAPLEQPLPAFINLSSRSPVLEIFSVKSKSYFGRSQWVHENVDLPFRKVWLRKVMKTSCLSFPSGGF